MNHVFGGVPSSDRDKRFATDKKCCSLNKFSTHLKGSCRDGQHRMKRLKSRRERSQARAGGKVSQLHHHHHCRHQTKEGPVHVHNCCQSSCLSKRDAPFASVIPTAREPSVITGSRLIGHQGLFNHEVKSIDIERMLSGGKEEKEKNATSQPSVTSPTPSPNPKTDLPCADTGNVSPFVTKATEKEEKSPGSYLTPGQKTSQQLDTSSGSVRSIMSSKHGLADAVAIQSLKANDDKSEIVIEAQLPPTVDAINVRTLNKHKKAYVVSTLEHNAQIQEESRDFQTQAHNLSPSSAQLSSSHTPDVPARKHPDSVLESVGTVAARLFNCVQLPPLSRRSLVAESREMLLRALQERHGSRVEDQICKMQRSLSSCSDAMDVQDQQNELLASDHFATSFQANAVRQPHFHTSQTTSFDLTRSRHFARKSNPQLRHSSKWPVEQLTSPTETPVRCLDNIFRPVHSPQFSMAFECSGVTARDLFSSSPDAGWGIRVSASQRQEDMFKRPEQKEAVMFGSFENRFKNLTKDAPKRQRGPQHNDPHPLFPDGAQLPHRHSAELFETERYTFAQSSSSAAAQIKHTQQSSSQQPSSQFSQMSAWPPLRPSHSDMTHCPPAHSVERDWAPLVASFPSPNNWTFHPMRLY